MPFKEQDWKSLILYSIKTNRVLSKKHTENGDSLEYAVSIPLIRGKPNLKVGTLIVFFNSK